MRRLAAPVLLAAVLAAGGCGGLDEEAAPERLRLELGGREAPREATLRYLERVRLSSWPLALAQFEPSLRARFGLQRLAASLVFLRDTIAARESVALLDRAGRRRALVRIRVSPSIAGHSSFTVRLINVDGRWLIAHDELASLTILKQFELIEQSAIDPEAPVSDAATRRARAVRRAFDEAGLAAFRGRPDD